MIDSKVILHDIYFDTYVNFLGTYPMFYIAGMCDVTYIGVYNTYLHGKCFLSALYDINSHVSPHSKQSTMHRPTSHFLQKYGVVRVCFCSKHTQHLPHHSLHPTVPPLFRQDRVILNT